MTATFPEHISAERLERSADFFPESQELGRKRIQPSVAPCPTAGDFGYFDRTTAKNIARRRMLALQAAYTDVA